LLTSVKISREVFQQGKWEWNNVWKRWV